MKLCCHVDCTGMWQRIDVGAKSGNRVKGAPLIGEWQVLAQLTGRVMLATASRVIDLPCSTSTVFLGGGRLGGGRARGHSAVGAYHVPSDFERMANLRETMESTLGDHSRGSKGEAV